MTAASYSFPLSLSLLFCKMGPEGHYLGGSGTAEGISYKQGLAHSKCSIKLAAAGVVIVALVRVAAGKG